MSLSDQHLSELNGSCINREVIESRGYRSVDESCRGELSELGVPAWAMGSESAFPGLLIPMYRVTGEQTTHQFKPAQPQVSPGREGKPMKYVSMRGSSNSLDVHPSASDLVRNETAPLWVTEGVKKADALVSRGVAAIALTGVWNWRSKTGTLGDWEDVPLKGRTVVVCFDADAKQKRHVMQAMKRFGAWLSSKKVGAVQYLIVPDSFNGTAVKGVDDYFAAGGDLADLRDHSVKELPIDGAKDASFSDTYLTDTVCEEALTDRFLWAKSLGWMKYDGSRWTESSEVEVTEEVRLWAIDKWQEVLTEQKRDPNRDMKSAVDGWRSVLSAGRLRALVALAKGPLYKDASEFDTDPDLLNCPNGVVDLRTGELLAPSPSYLMTKMAGVNYRPDFSCADWSDALQSLPSEVLDWYQIRIGQAFTGHMTPDDLLIIQQGGGENGKSTLNVPLSKAAGSYAVHISHRVLMGNSDQHPTEMMDFRGARYAMMEETPEARRLDPHHLRQTIGTPTITARRIRQDSVTFQTSHSMFINTNFTPSVTESDHGTWRRLALLKFPYTFRKRQEDVTQPNDRLGDPALRDRLMNSPGGAEAALAWAVRGSVKWYANNRAMPQLPPSVKRDTRTWRQEGDMILGFVSERVAFDQDCVASSAEVYEAFAAWLTPQGQKAWSAKLFKKRFEEHEEIATHHVQYGVKKVRGKATKVWSGITLDVPGRDPFDPESGRMTEGPENNTLEDRVTAVTAVGVNALEGSTREVTEAAVTAVTSQLSSTELDQLDQPFTLIGFDLETRSADQLWGPTDPSFIRIAGEAYDDADN